MMPIVSGEKGVGTRPDFVRHCSTFLAATPLAHAPNGRCGIVLIVGLPQCQGSLLENVFAVFAVLDHGRDEGTQIAFVLQERFEKLFLVGHGSHCPLVGPDATPSAYSIKLCLHLLFPTSSTKSNKIPGK